MQLVAPFVDLMFYAQSLNFMMVYIWAKRNPGLQIRRAEVPLFVHKIERGGLQFAGAAQLQRPISSVGIADPVASFGVRPAQFATFPSLARLLADTTYRMIYWELVSL
jgi:hypothetical protein